MPSASLTLDDPPATAVPSLSDLQFLWDAACAELASLLSDIAQAEAAAQERRTACATAAREAVGGRDPDASALRPALDRCSRHGDLLRSVAAAAAAEAAAALLSVRRSAARARAAVAAAETREETAAGAGVAQARRRAARRELRRTVLQGPGDSQAVGREGGNNGGGEAAGVEGEGEGKGEGEEEDEDEEEGVVEWGRLLQCAARGGHSRVVALVAEAGVVPVDCANRRGSRPLHYAAQRDAEEAAAALLRAGADPNARTAAGFAPLAVSVLHWAHRVTRLLLVHGADPNVSTLEGESPLTHAALRACPRVGELLLSHGADPNHVTGRGGSVLTVAAHHRCHGLIVSLLARGARPNHRDRNGNTALALSAVHGALASVRVLLQAGADPDAGWGGRGRLMVMLGGAVRTCKQEETRPSLLLCEAALAAAAAAAATADTDTDAGTHDTPLCTASRRRGEAAPASVVPTGLPHRPLAQSFPCPSHRCLLPATCVPRD